MWATDMVDTALVGFDRHELVKPPPVACRRGMGCLGGRTAGDVGPSVDEHPCTAICGGSMSPEIESGTSCRLSQQRLAQASGRSAEPEGTWNWAPCGGCASSTTSEYA